MSNNCTEFSSRNNTALCQSGILYIIMLHFPLLCTAFKIEPIGDANDNDAYINHSNYESEKSHNDCEYHDEVTAGVSVNQPIRESLRQVQNGVD